MVRLWIYREEEGGARMKVTSYAKHLTLLEKGKEEMTIAQVAELLKILNLDLKKYGINLYQIIKNMKEEKNGRKCSNFFSCFCK